ncbi:MAG: type II toxin-antitoxin system VapC family toxin [Candidatus Kapabacteria bacterium]|nr:type II toxin-antitoxin system VapC family toxin [Candidatus Kapabacteria bacterium]
MNIVDSSFWIEFFIQSEISYQIYPIIEKRDLLIVPSIVLLEVVKKILRDRSENEALECISFMKLANIVPLDDDLALNAAFIGNKYKLPLADSIIYATTLKSNAILFTLDRHFDGLPNVQYFQK